MHDLTENIPKHHSYTANGVSSRIYCEHLFRSLTAGCAITIGRSFDSYTGRRYLFFLATFPVRLYTRHYFIYTLFYLFIILFIHYFIYSLFYSYIILFIHYFIDTLFYMYILYIHVKSSLPWIYFFDQRIPTQG